jgi:hypothetical protein
MELDGINKRCFKTMMLSLVLVITMLFGCSSMAAAERHDPCGENGTWIAGDFHQHTTYTDGSNPIATVMHKNNEFGLDWWANSEHGGGFTRDGYGPVIFSNFDTGQYARYWDDTSVYPAGTILGDISSSSGRQNMWRWQSIRDFSFSDILTARHNYPKKVIIQGLEWNVPGHEHCSTAVITGQFGFAPNAASMAEFEYKFDNSDTDTTGGADQGWTKSTLSGHDKAKEAAKWMQDHHRYTSWLIPAHPERKGLYKIEHFRDLNNVAPDVAFGFESIPGHQKASYRGSYSSSAVGKGTYGGAGYFSEKIGGLWDALLGEGRHWWLFASSDFHETGEDFWPGEYTKTWTYITDENRDRNYSAKEIVDALRSGNSFVVHGDLISALDYNVQYWNNVATMGQELTMRRGDQLKIKIRFKNPAHNNDNDPVRVDHIDLIAGEVTGLIPVTDPNYTKDTNDTAKVIATFTAADWDVDKDGWHTVVYTIKKVKENMYFRLRGTNLAPNTFCETDNDGNPLLDRSDPILNPGCEQYFVDHNSTQEAWADLWFYSNPIFVKVK